MRIVEESREEGGEMRTESRGGWRDENSGRESRGGWRDEKSVERMWRDEKGVEEKEGERRQIEESEEACGRGGQRRRAEENYIHTNVTAVGTSLSAT